MFSYRRNVLKKLRSSQKEIGIKSRYGSTSVGIYFKFLSHESPIRMINKVQTRKNTPPHNIVKFPSYSTASLSIHIKKKNICRRNAYMHTSTQKLQ